MKILFITSVAVITPNPAESRRLFIDTLGLPLKHPEGDDYYFSASIAGSKHFGVWPLSQAAEACFGTRVADKESVASAAKELQSSGYALLHDVRTEPWGQTIARIQTPEGAIIGISYAPSMHESDKVG